MTRLILAIIGVILFISIVLVGFIAGMNSIWDMAKNDGAKYKAYMETKNSTLYDAWTKSTGNPKNLTKEEFIALKNEGLLK